jgi:hypothetical protein
MYLHGLYFIPTGSVEKFPHFWGARANTRSQAPKMRLPVAANTRKQKKLT